MFGTREHSFYFLIKVRLKRRLCTLVAPFCLYRLLCMAYGAAGRTFHYATRSTRLPACHPCARKIKLAPLFHTPPGAIQGALQSIRNVPKHFTGAPVRTSNTKRIQFLPMNLHMGSAAHRYCCRCCVDYFSSIDFFLASIF